MEESHRSKKLRTETWSPDDAGPKSHHGYKKARNSRSDSERPTHSHQDHKSRPRRHASPLEHGRQQFHRRESRDSFRPQNAPSKDTRSAPSRPNRSRTQPQQFQPNNHTTKSRKNNPSTRIRSLRKQLAHPSAATLPANVLADRKRELQFLLDSRDSPQPQNGAEKTSRGQREKKILGQYHMVRFFERRRAERNLKRARKQAESAEVDEDEIDQQEKKLSHEALQKEADRSACDLLYSIYAPLGEKYIALFAGGGQTEKSKHLDAEKKAGKAKDNRQPQDKLPKDYQHVVGISTQGQDDISRPPHWHTIQAILHDPVAKDTEDDQADMLQVPKDNDAWTSVSVTPAQLHQLEALRDGKEASDLANADQKETDRVKPIAAAAGKKRKVPSWPGETGELVDSTGTDMDMDSDGGMAMQGQDGDDGSESDGDGGFFER